MRGASQVLLRVDSAQRVLTLLEGPKIFSKEAVSTQPSAGVGSAWLIVEDPGVPWAICQLLFAEFQRS